MNKLAKWVVAVVCGFGIVVASHAAQGGPVSGTGTGGSTDQTAGKCAMGAGAGKCQMNAGKCGMMKGITLTEEQQKKIADIRAACGKGTCTPETRAKCQADIRAVLTTEQQAAYDKNVEAMKAKMANRPAGCKGPCKMGAKAEAAK